MAKVCPLLTSMSGRIIAERIPAPCMREKCMWWVDGNCAILVIAKNLKSIKST